MVDTSEETRKFQKELDTGTTAPVLSGILARAPEAVYGYQISRPMVKHAKDMPNYEAGGASIPGARVAGRRRPVERHAVKTCSGPLRTALIVLMMLATIALVVTVIYYRDYLEQFSNLGYFSAFIFGFLAGSSIPVPVPYILVTFSVGSVLNPLLTGLFSGLGAGFGGGLVYLFGNNGGQLLSGKLFGVGASKNVSSRWQRFFLYLQKWTCRRGSLAVFVMSAVFNPVFAPLAIALGAMRFGFRRFLLWCILGSIVKSLFIAYCGYFGLGTILRWVGG